MRGKDMKTMILDEKTVLTSPCVATIGFFDGVHLGHQFLIHQVVKTARDAGLSSLVITFDKHPRQVLHSHYVPELLTTTEQKLQLLSATAVDRVVVLPFTQEMASMTAQQFMADVLHRRLQVRKLVIGYDNRFGHNREDGFDDYVRYGRALGIEVIRSEEFSLGKDAVHVSSSAIRKYIHEGSMEQANRCLGRPYVLTAHVVDGCKEGRKLGFPTANLNLNEITQLLPAMGVYAVKAQVEGAGPWYRAMTSIGMRPTYNGTNLTVETHILEGFHENIYDKQLSVAFFKRLRGEKRFDNLALLHAKIAEDAREVDSYFNKIEK